jgi:parvulin-like peptidyl-prolyl isomerase
MTRRRLAQWQRQQRRQRFTFISGGVVIIAIILIVLAGWYVSDYRPMHRTVIRVNDTEFNMGYLVSALRVIGVGQSEGDYQDMVDNIVSEVERSEIIRQGAAVLGVSVSDADAEARLTSLNITVNKATIDLARSQLLSENLQQGYFNTQVPQTAAQANIQAMFLESQSQAAEIRDRLLGSENFTALAGEYSLDSYSKSKRGDIGWHPKDIFAVMLGSPVPGDYAFGAEAGSLSPPLSDNKSKPLGYWLINILEKDSADATDAQVQALLLGSQAEALGIRERLVAGDNVTALAKEFSQNEQSQKNGGEMGVVSEGEVSTAFDSFVFDKAAQVREWSFPVSDNTVTTTGGCWLVDVLEKADDRQIDSTDRNYLISKVYSEWVKALWDEAGNKIESYLETGDKAWVAKRAAGG